MWDYRKVLITGMVIVAYHLSYNPSYISWQERMNEEALQLILSMIALF